MTAADPSVSVVVPTRDRADRLVACLAALEAQSCRSFEVVVVDDASVDAAAVATVVATAPHARLLHGTGRGPAAARNAGAAAALAPVLCFTDDDCRPVPGWLDALARRIGAGADAVAGPTRNGVPGDPFATASQAITNHLVDESLDPSTGRLGFAPTSNLACRAELHRALPFDEGYPLAAGEDRDWCARLADRGATLVLEPSAVVVHHHDLSARGYWRQQLRYGRGAHRYHRERPAAAGWPPLRFYTGLLRAGLAHGPRVGTLVVAAQVAVATGLVQEAIAARRT